MFPGLIPGTGCYFSIQSKGREYYRFIQHTYLIIAQHFEVLHY